MDILVLLIFLVLYFLCASIILLIHYYYRILFPGKGQYNREELIKVRSILSEELDNLFAGKEKSHEYLALIAGSITGFILTYTGGLWGENYESYLFHSIVLPALLYAGMGYIKKTGIEENLPAILKLLFQHDFSIFAGFALSTLAKSIMVYGVYHVISFLWIFPNIVALGGLIITRIVEKYKKEDYKLFFGRKLSDN
ncbi:MAG: hypothetical protein OEV66_11520 [Spirochaetia bacterium]|nr:hypothetical protein [Spirochaetia bacterium]